MTLRTSLLDFGCISLDSTSGSWFSDPAGFGAIKLGIYGPSGELEDIVAWAPNDEFHWALRLRRAVLLGEENAEWADYLDEPLTVRSTPERWLRAGENGCVVLDWQHDLRLYLGNHRRLFADTAQLVQKLHQTLGSHCLQQRIDLLETVGRAA